MLSLFQYFQRHLHNHYRFRKYLFEFGIVLLIGTATAFLNLRMIRDGLNGQIDLLWHVTWLQHFSHQLSEGVWYPRWLAGTNYGYGSPTFVFYPPLVYYIGSVFKLGGLNIEQTMVVLFSLAIFFAGVNFYVYGKNHWGRIASLSSALIYMSIPYMTFMTYWVSSLSSVFAIALLPLGWWLTEKTLVQARWRIALALFWTTLALTHLPSFLLFFLVWLICTLFFSLKRPLKNVLRVFIFTGIGIGMASLYLLPAMLEKRLVHIDAMKNVGGGFKNFMLGASTQPFIPLNLNGGSMHVFIHQSLISVIVAIVALLLFRNHTPVLRKTFLWITFLIVISFLMSSFSWPIWRLSQTFQRVQTPLRLLPVFSFGVAALCGSVTHELLSLRSKKIKVFVVFLVIGILLSNFIFNYNLSRRFPALHNPGRANLEHLKDFKTALYEPFTEKLKDVSEYRPLLQSSQPSPAPRIGEAPFSIIQGSAKIKIQQWKSYRRIFDIDTNETSLIRIRTYFYPAWHLYVDQQPRTIKVLDDGTMGLLLEPGSYLVELRYQQTRAVALGSILSILSVIGLFSSSFLDLWWKRDRSTTRKVM